MDLQLVKFAYELKGKQKKVTLQGREVFVRYVLPEDLVAIKFSRIQEKVEVMTVYGQSYEKEAMGY